MKIIYLHENQWVTVDTPPRIKQVDEPGKHYRPLWGVREIRKKAVYAVHGREAMWFPMSCMAQDRMGRLYASTWAIQKGLTYHPQHVHYRERPRMFKPDRIIAITKECTHIYRKGEVVHGTPDLVGALLEGREELPGGTLSIDLMEPVSDAPAGEKLIDTHFIVVGVNMAKAEKHKRELQMLLNFWPMDRLREGPSYIEVGAELGDQELAFQLYALGEALDMWKVITPKTFGLTGVEADEMAGGGLVMISGFKFDYATADDNPCL